MSKVLKLFLLFHSLEFRPLFYFIFYIYFQFFIYFLFSDYLKTIPGTINQALYVTIYLCFLFYKDTCDS